jgi:heme/copper-type cytochrome/quinol oxidase subunit 2
MIKINFLEKNINKSSSLINSFTNLFITMLVILGLITGFVIGAFIMCCLFVSKESDFDGTGNKTR